MGPSWFGLILFGVVWFRQRKFWGSWKECVFKRGYAGVEITGFAFSEWEFDVFRLPCVVDATHPSDNLSRT